MCEEILIHQQSPELRAPAPTRTGYAMRRRNLTEVEVNGLHFVQEDSSDEIGTAIAEFVRQLRKTFCRRDQTSACRTTDLGATSESDRTLEALKRTVVQAIIGMNAGRQDRRLGNPSVAGSSPARPLQISRH